HAALERGSLIEAACLLREAVRLYLKAECEYWGCIPTKKQQRIPALLLQALRKCEDLKSYDWDWLEEIIGHCNKLAHCQSVSRSLIESCISVAHCYLDGADYLVQPAAAGRLS